MPAFLGQKRAIKIAPPKKYGHSAGSELLDGVALSKPSDVTKRRTPARMKLRVCRKDIGGAREHEGAGLVTGSEDLNPFPIRARFVQAGAKLVRKLIVAGGILLFLAAAGVVSLASWPESMSPWIPSF